MDSCKLTFDAKATVPDLILSVKLDGLIIFNGHLAEDFQQISHEFDDSDSEHLLEFEMTGKMMHHTTVDPQGQILFDQVIIIENLSFDDIPLGHTFSELADYHHDFNGTQTATVEKFYGTMGCNGTIRFKFSTPIYLWLLENI